MKKKIIAVLLGLLLMGSVFSFALLEKDKTDNNVLIIHSYYQHFAWTKSLQDGIETRLKEENIDYYLEYLDEHRLTGSIAKEDIYQRMLEKYEGITFDCVVVADNFAYNFVRDYYDDLFEGVPLVLVGINNMNEGMFFMDNMTGIAQTADHKRMIELVEKLHPESSRIVIAGSGNQTSLNEERSYRSAVKALNVEKKTDFIEVQYLEDLYTKLTYYNDDTVVIVTSLIYDRDKTMNLGPKYISNIINETGLPVYVAVDVMMGDENDGAIGGYIVDGQVHGELAAEMVNQIMDGKQANDIPIVWESIVTPQFNYQRLREFNIDFSLLPESSVILGVPHEGIVVSNELAIAYVTIIVLLVLFLMLLIHQVVKRRRAEISLMDHQEELKTSNQILLKQNDEIEFLLNNDAITNFQNRNRFIEDMNERLKDEGCIVMYAVHVRNIKDIDDAYGYNVGDNARLELSKKIRMIFGEDSKSFARYYDTFYIADFKERACDDVNTIVLNLKQKIQESIQVSKYAFEPKVKLGIVRGTKDDRGLDMLKKADITILNAMLSEQELAKEYDQSFHHRMEEKLAMEQELKEAIRHESFELYFQPQVSCKDEKVVSCEALIRWRNQEQRYVSPSTFIPLAEEIGLINAIGDWVLDQACKISKEWEEEGINCPISINVSAKQINHFLPHAFKKAMDEYELTPDRLLLEITETSVMDDTQNNIRILKEISQLGVGIALDDFGVGHSSMKYIMDFPINKLKIDKSFIDNITNPEQYAIVKAMYELGRVFHYHVIAEGVETQEQKDVVQEIGIEAIQGWYYSKALPDKQFRDYIKSNDSAKNDGDDIHVDTSRCGFFFDIFFNVYQALKWLKVKIDKELPNP